MKILFISEYYPTQTYLNIRGGVELRAARIARILSKVHRLYIITSKQSTPTKVHEGNLTIIYVGKTREYTRTGVLTRIDFIWRAFWASLHVDYDLVEGSGLIGWLPAWLSAKIKRKKVVAVVADTVSNYTRDLRWWQKEILHVWEKVCLWLPWDQIVCISRTVADQIRSLHVRSTVNVIYCGLDFQEFSQIKDQISKQPTISCVSRLVPYKRIEDLLVARKLLHTKWPNLKIKIIGSGDQLLYLRQLAQRLRIGADVTFLGFIEKHREVLRLVKKSTVFCLPSIVEGFGIATLEAVAAGVPAVVADIPVNREVTHKLGVIYFQPMNAYDLAVKLDAELERHKKGESFLLNTRLLNRFDWKIIAAQTEKLYASLCAD